MPIVNDSYQTMPLTDIYIPRDERQRRVIKTDDLEGSIALRGVLNPVIVSGDVPPFRLVAGERRYEACKRIGLTQIPFRNFRDLDPIEAQIIELEENIKRQDLEWQDLVMAVGRIHQLYKLRRSNWTGHDTARECALTDGTVSLYLTVYAKMDDERIVKSSTVREAYNILARRDQRAAGDAIQQMIEAAAGVVPLEQELPPPAPPPDLPPGVIWLPPAVPAKLVDDAILHESFQMWLGKYNGRRFNLVHCDFPYGINVFAGPQAGGNRHEGGYSDSPEEYFSLLNAFCENLDVFMAQSAHLFFWFSARHRVETMRIFAEKAPSLKFYPFDLIWVKSDNAGISFDPSHTPRHVYETCLFGTRGDRNIIKIVSDVQSCPTDKRLHPSTKPEPMLKNFLSMVCDDSSSLFDPTCGSGAALRAAESLGATRVLGMDVDERIVADARRELKISRDLRFMSRTVEAE